MFLIIVALLLILGIALFQVVQGLFSALIMTILSLLSALIAFNYYEPLAAAIFQWTDRSGDPMYLHGSALVGLFVAILLALRLVFDKLLSSNVVFGVWADRIGGGALGIITGMICIGVLTVGIQALPWDASIMGYEPFGKDLKKDSSLAPFYPDRFVLASVSGLSQKSLKGSPIVQFDQLHDDYLLELFAERNRCELPGRNDAKPGSFNVLSVSKPQPAPEWLGQVPAYPPLGEQVSDVYLVRVKVAENCRDTDGWFRLPGTHFRLVSDKNKSYYPVAFLAYGSTTSGAEKQGLVPIADVKDGLSQPGSLIVERNTQSNAKEKSDGLIIDWVYRIPMEEKPKQFVFRRTEAANAPKLTNELPATETALRKR